MSERDDSQQDYNETPTIQELQAGFAHRCAHFERGKKTQIVEHKDGTKTSTTYTAYELPTLRSEGTADFLLEAAQSGFSLWGSVKLDNGASSIVILQSSSSKE